MSRNFRPPGPAGLGHCFHLPWFHFGYLLDGKAIIRAHIYASSTRLQFGHVGCLARLEHVHLGVFLFKGYPFWSGFKGNKKELNCSLV